ncbi:uncharacterized protein N7477_009440 [Penicillium maclennaniae]|uniref:uncharacterized protein n=1 Tax=Penicillium maclennaniae TaxID=1343394 RepID=UPI002542128E|nr:uncharacterized protein N7477_009440 [Penicillium maclennaniae]KAJ5661824.1 hypothetical protein N7477_009440 [Penicillium maclennaniae]
MSNHRSSHDDQPPEPHDVAEHPSLVSRSMSDSGRRTSQQHVRFSTDLERAPVDERQAGWDRRPSSRGLTMTINTALAPPTVTSPARSPTSPLSPRRSRSRNRGYSLRRSIFNRNIQTTSETDVGDAELGEAKGPNPVPEDGPAPALIEHVVINDKDELTIAPTATVGSLKETSTYPSTDSSERAFIDYYISAQDTWVKKKAATAAICNRVEAVMTAMQRVILRIKDIPPTQDGRHIDLNPSSVENLLDERTGKPYVGNWIRSSRYSFWSFFPRQLFAQFTKMANFYFLIVAILQMIPGLSTTGTYTTIVPLLIFVGISMGKEGFDDWRRYRLDKEENNRFAWVLRCSEAGQQVWVEIKWQDIRVGDVIKLGRDEPVPADFVLLHANGTNGVAYIETMALDGETNLKNKQPCQAVSKVCSTVEDITSNSLHFVVEDPNLDLYKFDGHVTVNAQEKLPLTNNEIVYRGSILRNTDETIGMVIYTGEECKIRMNANKNPRIKKPTLQSKVNHVVMLIVGLVVILAVVCTICYKYWEQDVGSRSWYLTNASVSYGPIFTSFLIMFNTMIPISLYVSMEIVKVVQMFLLNDIDMYDPRDRYSSRGPHIHHQRRAGTN